MKKAIIVLAVVVLVGGSLAVGWWYINENPQWRLWVEDEFQKAVDELGLEPQEKPHGLFASGFIEAEEASVTTEQGGRIVALHAGEGDKVVAGQDVAQLDDSVLLSQIEMAKAEVAVAEADLALVKAGVREESLTTARAMLNQAKVAEAAAKVAWEDAQAILENPQDMQLAITAARTQLGVLDFQQQQAQALANAAQVGSDLADETVRLLNEFEPRAEWVLAGTYSLDNLPPEFDLPLDLPDGEYRIGKFRVVVSGNTITVYAKAHIRVPIDWLETARKEQVSGVYESWIAWTGLGQAQAARSGAEDYVVELMRQIANPLTLQAEVNAAKSQYDISAAATGLAQAHVDGLQIGATPEQIAAVEAQVEIARSALGSLEVRLGKLTLQSPISGLVLERPVHAGGVALPGAPLMTLADLDNVALTIYVPEDQLGKVQIGQSVAVTVDAYPERVFQGTVILIASEAEFTPKNVQTRDERVNMVFAVKVKVPNPDHALKPGMPADAELAEN